MIGTRIGTAVAFALAVACFLATVTALVTQAWLLLLVALPFTAVFVSLWLTGQSIICLEKVDQW